MLTFKHANNNPIIDIEDISEAVIQALVSDTNMDIDAAYDIYYRSNVYQNLEDINTEFYQKSWEEIYRLLQSERGKVDLS
jgi:hypothetical protein